MLPNVKNFTKNLCCVFQAQASSCYSDATRLYTEVHFASFLSGEFITAVVVNPPERKLAKRTSVDYYVLLGNCTPGNNRHFHQTKNAVAHDPIRDRVCKSTVVQLRQT